MLKIMWRLFGLLVAGVFVLCMLTPLRRVTPSMKWQSNNGLDTSACPDVISSKNIIEMHYATASEEYSFLVSLHPPDEDHVLSKGIKEGLFGPKNKYPSIDEMHAICATNVACDTGNVFVEVGSALGVISIYMGRRGMKVYAFDPMLPNVQRLSESRCLNNARMCGNTTESDCTPFFSQSNFHALWHAVSSGEGPRSVQMQSEPQNMAATMRGGGSFKAEVQITTIDESVQEESIELLLLTCQGNEYNALLGASNFLKSGKIRNIVFRRHSTRPEHDESALGIMRLLGSHGYIFFNLEATRASGKSPVRVSFAEMLDYVTKLHMSGGHPNILASLSSNDKNYFDCGYRGNIPPPKSQLASFISKALHKIQNDPHPLCVLEVGTADGTGTTISLFDALQANCVRNRQAGFRLYTYEVNVQAAAKAKNLWLSNSCDRNRGCVEIVNEIVLDEAAMDRFIVQQIDGPDSDAFPGKQFYHTFYSNLQHCIGTNECGSFFHTIPPCTLDLVLIDGTRFSHAGIVQTLLQTRGLTSQSTVFIIEDDFWPSESAGGGSESRILRQFWNLTEVEMVHPDGEMWPWVSFRIK